MKRVPRTIAGLGSCWLRRQNIHRGRIGYTMLPNSPRPVQSTMCWRIREQASRGQFSSSCLLVS
jgi:hypothetical protein